MFSALVGISPWCEKLPRTVWTKIRISSVVPTRGKNALNAGGCVFLAVYCKCIDLDFNVVCYEVVPHRLVMRGHSPQILDRPTSPRSDRQPLVTHLQVDRSLIVDFDIPPTFPSGASSSEFSATEIEGLENCSLGESLERFC